MMKAQKSDIEFLDYKITKFEYVNLLQSKEENIKYEVRVNPQIGKIVKDDEHGKYFVRLDLALQINGKKGRTILTKIRCSITGLFAGSTKLNEKDFLSLCATSGFANLIMITRSVIISFTSQSGNIPVIMPLINLLKTYEQNSQKKE
ncbi:protein-export chaperone SecB [Thermosipho atlanticus]|uniref:Preprotein translocase subunit SecB n=1 Tax=Thermosipho atlanticus DSM 15807 TaxID=1123380 RepID=A0A1M5RN22_9BACT|nr:protein-export chaperone SecB [Thermosipho atlanticus]SHH27655.1 Preprotein translocase subunit SecB [Thermosipho atlanticus DSM 15807]